MAARSDLVRKLSAEQIAWFNETGYLVFENFVDEETLASLRVAYEEVLEGVRHAEGDRMLGGITRQVMYPSKAHPTFESNAALETAKGLATQILGTALFAFDMLIFKPPGHPYDTPWHQDASYYKMPFAPAGMTIPLQMIQFWIALDDADAENGCMHFIPGQQVKPLLEHYVASGDPEDEGRLLAITDPSVLDLSSAVCAAIPAGGVTLHSYGTPHYTPPNRSADRARRAYIFSLKSVDA